MSVRCGCGRETNSPTGVCIICEKFDNLNAPQPCLPDRQAPLSLRGGEGELQNNGGEVMAEHLECEHEGCEKIRVKERLCTRHYNKKHGIVKRKGRQPKKVVKLPPPVIIIREQVSRVNDNDVLAKLWAKQEELQRDLAGIDAAIETINKHV
jgi:hypothetical protein